MILYGNDVSDSDRLFSLRIFERLPYGDCRSSTGSGDFFGYSFNVVDFNGAVRAKLAPKERKNISTQTCDEDFHVAARAASPSVINKEFAQKFG